MLPIVYLVFFLPGAVSRPILAAASGNGTMHGLNMSRLNTSNVSMLGRRLAQCPNGVRTPSCLASKVQAMAQFTWNSAKTVYRHQYMRASGAACSTSRPCETDCSGFVKWAIEQSQSCLNGNRIIEDVKAKQAASGFQTRRRFRYRASDFYEAFGMRSNYWCTVETFRNIKRGDILVYKIREQEAGGDSGHIMVALDEPKYTHTVETPMRMKVYALKVADSSNGAHFDYNGFTDTRRSCPDGCGLGIGYVYAWVQDGVLQAIRLRDSVSFSQSNADGHLYRIARLRS